MSLDPGGMVTSITRNSEAPFLIKIFVAYIAPYIQAFLTWLSPNGAIRTPTKSGADLLRAAFDVKTLGERPKAVYLDGTAYGQTAAEARDEVKQKQLWKDSVKLARVQAGETVLQDLN